MDRDQIFNVIKAKIIEIKGETRKININDYIDYRGGGLNSIELLTLIVNLEEHFEFETDDEDLSLERFIFIKDIVDLVSEKVI